MEDVRVAKDPLEKHTSDEAKLLCDNEKLMERTHAHKRTSNHPHSGTNPHSGSTLESEDNTIESYDKKLALTSKLWNSIKNCCTILHKKSILKYVVLFIGPCLASPFLFDILKPGNPNISHCAFVTIWMSIWWIFEPIPIPITSLLPLILFPLLGTMNAKDVASAYFNDIVALFMGSYIVAISLEKWNLHKRFALTVLMLLGERPKLLLFGFMMIGWSMSMWLSNTCTTATLLPMANAILLHLSPNELKNIEQDHVEIRDHDKNIEDDSKISPKAKGFARAVILGVAYSTSIGGVSTLIGTGTNLIFVNYVSHAFPKFGRFPFITWSLFVAPISFIFIMITWVFFCILFVRNFSFSSLIERDTRDCEDSNDETANTLYQFSERDHDEKESHTHQEEVLIIESQIPLDSGVMYENDRSQKQSTLIESADERTTVSVQQVFRKEYKKLGNLKYEEIMLIILFTLMCLLWITRELPFETSDGRRMGWALWIFNDDSHITDATVSMIVALLLFVVPSISKSGERLLDWKTLQQKFPFGLMLLFGAGFSLAKAFSVTKFGQFVAEIISRMGSISPIIILAVICIFVTFFTEVSSNLAISSIMIPVLSDLALSPSVHQNPFLFIVPATICCSFAFMSPVGTPPNAISYSYGYVKLYEMATTGFMLNWCGIILVIIWTLLLGGPILGIQFGVIPNWAQPSNSTMVPT